MQFIDIKMPKYLHQLTDIEIQQRLKQMLDRYKQEARDDYLSVAELGPYKESMDHDGNRRIHTHAEDYAENYTDVAYDLKVALAEKGRNGIAVLDHTATNTLIDIDVEQVDRSDPAREKQYLEYRHSAVQGLIDLLDYTADLYTGSESPIVDKLAPAATPTVQPELVMTPEPAPLLSEVMEQYIAEQERAGDWEIKHPAVESDESKVLRTYVSEFIAHQEDLPCDAYSREDATIHHELLLHLPKSRTMTNIYKNLPLEDFLDIEIPEKKLLRSKTINDRLKGLNRLFEYAALFHKTVGTSPFAKMKQNRNSRPSRERLHFTADQLNSLFLSEEYLSSSHEYSWQHWQPLLALFTGARRAELGQLRIGDIREKASIHYFNIADPTILGNSCKSPSSFRKIPVHSELIALGLLDYKEWLKVDLGLVDLDPLFPDLLPIDAPLDESFIPYTKVVSRWYSNDVPSAPSYLGLHGIVAPEGKLLSFHSFRHTFNTRLNEERAPLDLLKRLKGHKSISGVTGDYDHSEQLQALQNTIELLGTYDLELSPLKEGWQAYKTKLPVDIDEAKVT